MEDLTPKEKELYDWIEEFISLNNYSPSIREMTKAMKLRSPSPIQNRLSNLKRKGYIKYKCYVARSVKIVKFDSTERILILLALSLICAVD